MSSSRAAVRIWDLDDEAHLIGGLLEAAAVSHGIPPQSDAWFRWKYCESPFGRAIVALWRPGTSVEEISSLELNRPARHERFWPCSRVCSAIASPAAGSPYLRLPSSRPL